MKPKTGAGDATTPLHRRDFLVAAGAAVASAVMRPPLAAAPPKYELTLGQWSFHRALLAKQLDPLDFPSRAKELGFQGVDYVNTFFKDKAGDRSYLAELEKRADGEGLVNDLILIDSEGVIGDPDASARTSALDNHKRWVEAAKALGCRGIRINALSRGTPDEQRKLAVEGTRALTEFADDHGIDILLENHGGLTSDAAWLDSVVRGVAHPRCGSLADFGNWSLGGGKWYDRYQGVAELVPTAKGISVKAQSFDADGNETTTDFARMMKIVVDGGYRGRFLEIEYEGEALGEAAGIRATKVLLERTLAALRHGGG
jgi:sugar phosphate isomerase/epimerase